MALFSGTMRPEDQTVNELQSATFEVAFDGAPPVSVQWYRNNVAIAGRVKWFTAPPQSLEPEAAQLAVDTPVMLAGTIQTDGEKRLYLGTDLVGSASGVSLTYDFGAEFTIGYLQGDRQYLVGTVAEVLIYSSVSDAQRAAVQDYLVKKYFAAIQPPATKLNISLSQNNVEITWTGAGTLQAAPAVTGSWSDLTEAKSPWSVSPTGAAQFYRLKQ